MTWEEFGSSVIDAAVCCVCVQGGRVFLMETSNNVIVQCTVPVPTYCTGSDLLDSSVTSKLLIKNSIHQSYCKEKRATLLSGLDGCSLIWREKGPRG